MFLENFAMAGNINTGKVADAAEAVQRHLRGRRSTGGQKPSFTQNQQYSARSRIHAQLDEADILAEKAAAEASSIATGIDGALNGMGTAIGIQVAPAAVAGAAGAIGWIGKKAGLSAVESAGRGAQGKVKGFMESTMQEAFGKNGAGKTIANTTGKITDFTGKILSKVGLKSAADAVQDIPANIGKSKIGEGLINSTWLAGSAVNMAGGALSFSKSLLEMKRLASEITGKHYSTWDVITGDIPDILKPERAFLLKGFAASEGSSTLSLGFAIRSVARGFSPALMLATGAISMGVNMLAGEGFLPAYSAMREAYDAGQPIPPEAYANLIGMASKEMAEHGGPGGAFAKKIAEQFAEEDRSPGHVLRETIDGRLMKRVQALIAAAEAEKAAANEANISHEKPAHSHVAALSAPKNEVKRNIPEREILGRNTQHVVDQTLASRGIEAASPVI